MPVLFSILAASGGISSSSFGKQWVLPTTGGRSSLPRQGSEASARGSNRCGRRKAHAFVGMAWAEAGAWIGITRR